MEPMIADETQATPGTWVRTPERTRPFRALAEEVCGEVFRILDARPDVTGDEAGQIARLCQDAVEEILGARR